MPSGRVNRLAVDLQIEENRGMAAVGSLFGEKQVNTVGRQSSDVETPSGECLFKPGHIGLEILRIMSIIGQCQQIMEIFQGFF